MSSFISFHLVSFTIGTKKDMARQKVILRKIVIAPFTDYLKMRHFPLVLAIFSAMASENYRHICTGSSSILWQSRGVFFSADKVTVAFVIRLQ